MLKGVTLTLQLTALPCPKNVAVSESSPTGPFFVTGNGSVTGIAEPVQISISNIKAGKSYIQVTNIIVQTIWTDLYLYQSRAL